jgi:hypothetical protein
VKEGRGETLGEPKVEVGADLDTALFGGGIMAKLPFCARRASRVLLLAFGLCIIECCVRGCLLCVFECRVHSSARENRFVQPEDLLA